MPDIYLKTFSSYRDWIIEGLPETRLGWKIPVYDFEWAIRMDFAPPKKEGPQRFSKITEGEWTLLMRGKGVSTAAVIGKKQYRVAALIPSDGGAVWQKKPPIKPAAQKAVEIWRERTGNSPGSLDPDLKTIRVVRVRRAARQGPGWYAYLCVPREVPGTPRRRPTKSAAKSRFKNLEL